MQDFNIKQYLTENKLTIVSRLLIENENINKIPILKVHMFKGGSKYDGMYIDYKANSEIGNYLKNSGDFKNKKEPRIYPAGVGYGPDHPSDIKGYYKIIMDQKHKNVLDKLGIKYKYIIPDIGWSYFLVGPEYVYLKEVPFKDPGLDKKSFNKYQKFKELLQQQGCKIILNDHSKSKYSYGNAYGKLKIQSSDTYDFGGAESALNDLATIVDYEYKEGNKPKIYTHDDIYPEPTGNNKYINQDLNKPFSFPPKMYGNMTAVYHHLENKNNIVNSVYNSLKPGGIFFISCSFIDVFDVYKRFSQKFKIIEIVIDEQELLNQNFDDNARNGEYFYLTFKK